MPICSTRPALQHHDLVGHGHGLDLIVGDVDHGGAEPLVELCELDPHLHPELGVEVRERLVEEENAGLADDGTADGDALALAARELRRLPVEERLDLEDARHVGDALADHRLRACPSCARPKPRLLRTVMCG